MGHRISVLAASAIALLALSGCGAPATRPSQPATPVVTADTALSQAPGTTWTYTAIASKGLSVSFDLAGPWNLVPDSSVNATEIANTVVPVADAPQGDRFPGAGFAVESVDESTGEVMYLFRSVEATAVYAHGRTQKQDGEWKADVYPQPLATVPLGMKVGDKVTLRKGDQFDIVATAISRSSAMTPAGEFKDALLVRYDFPRPDGSSAGNSVYYILAPGVEWVAYIVPGSQLAPTAPISDIVQIDIITTRPSAETTPAP